MKLYTFMENYYTADLWDFTVGTSPIDGVPVYTRFYLRSIKFAATTTGRTTSISFKDSDSDVVPHMHLKNFCDASGNEVIEGTTWELFSVEPALNMWGFREGFKAQAMPVVYPRAF